MCCIKVCGPIIAGYKEKTSSLYHDLTAWPQRILGEGTSKEEQWLSEFDLIRVMYDMEKMEVVELLW